MISDSILYDSEMCTPDDDKTFKVIFRSLSKSLAIVYLLYFVAALFSDPVSGASDDWAKAVAGVKYSYTYEFRPSTRVKRSGFILPPEEISPNSEEVFASLVAMANEVATTL